MAIESGGGSTNDASTSNDVEPPLNIQGIKPHYRTGIDDLATSFFVPCLKEARVYQRAAGYFSSMALLTWIEALPRLIRGEDLKVELIAAPELTAHDREVLRELVGEDKQAEYRGILVEKILNEVISLAESPSDDGIRARIFAWLLVNQRLDIRFAFAQHIEMPGIFHEKMGVFEFEGGPRVAFTGSANETLGGHRLNYESIDVYRSWVAGDAERVETKAAQFQEAWRNEAEGLDVEIMSAETIARLREKAPRTLPNTPGAEAPEHDENRRWRHQEEAVEVFLTKRAGVLEMATGTGKTRTTLKIVRRLIEEHGLKSAVIATDGTDLLDQWSSELDAWTLQLTRPWLVFRHYDSHKEMGEFALEATDVILVVSRMQLLKALRLIPHEAKQHMIIVHDEVHGLGVRSLVGSLKNQHRLFRWRLGLSATPERSYDEEGNRFIESEIGKTIYKFSLEDAIKRGVLSEFDYVPIPYQLTAGDSKRISAVYARRAARKRDGDPMSDEEFWNELAKVYKTAEMKPVVFMEYLSNNVELLKDCIIFVEEKEYGNKLLDD